MNLLSRRRALLMNLKKILKKVFGIPPLVLENTNDENVIDYKIDGNSIQDGEPTPETPIEVESIGERTINLFEKKTDSISTNAAYKGLDMRGWKQTAYTLQIKLKEGKTVPSGAYFGFVYIDSAAYWLVDNGVINSKYNGIVSVNTATINGVCCYPDSKSEAFWDAFDIFLVQGDYTTDTIPDFETIGYKIPVVAQGKNLFNINNTDGWTLNSSSYHHYDIYVGANQTITASWDTDLTKGQGFYLCIGNTSAEKGESANSTWLYHSTASDGTRNKAVTVKADAEGYIYINMAPLNYDKIQKLQIEYGNTVTEFEPYQEPITTNIYLDKPLSKIGDYADYIDFANRKMVRNIEQIYVSKVDARSSVTTHEYCVFLSNVNKKPYLEGSSGKSKGFAISNKFKQSDVVYNDLYDYPNLIQSYITNSGGYRLAYTIGDTTVRTVEAAQAAIGDGFEAYYVLETPTEELVELPQLPTLKGTTVYTVDTTIQPSNMEVSYYS